MKKIILAATFTAILTTAAFAQGPYGYYYYGPSVVVADGRVIGRDPDPNVRLEIRRDSLLSDIYQY